MYITTTMCDGVLHYTVSDSCFCFSGFFSSGRKFDRCKIHSSEVKMYSADVKIQVIIRNQQISI